MAIATLRRSALRGFTMIELMIVVTIVGAMLAFGLPEMRNLIKNQRLKTTSLDIFASLQLARSEAIKRNTSNVIMAASGGSWQAGWNVCVDANANGGCDGGELVLISQDAISDSITVAGPAAAVAYARDGRLPSGAAAAHFSLTAVGGNASTPMRCVDVDLSGRPRTRADMGSGC